MSFHLNIGSSDHFNDFHHHDFHHHDFHHHNDFHNDFGHHHHHNHEDYHNFQNALIGASLMASLNRPPQQVVYQPMMMYPPGTVPLAVGPVAAMPPSSKRKRSSAKSAPPPAEDPEEPEDPPEESPSEEAASGKITDQDIPAEVDKVGQPMVTNFKDSGQPKGKKKKKRQSMLVESRDKRRYKNENKSCFSCCC